LSRGSGPASYPAEPLVSYQINRQLSGWNLPPLMIRAFGAHGQYATSKWWQVSSTHRKSASGYTRRYCDATSGEPRTAVRNQIRNRWLGNRDNNGGGLGHRDRPERHRTYFRCSLYDKVRGHGDGIVYLSLDHRSARWPALGIAQGNARVGVQSGLAEQQLMTLWVTPPRLVSPCYVFGVIE